MDPVGRAWEWKFIPKDFDESEWSAHLGTLKRLTLVFDRAEQHGSIDLRRNVAFRGDAIMVMAEDEEEEEELFRLSTIVTFAMQTKPWLMEVDLWKRFVNVGLEFLGRGWIRFGWSDEQHASPVVSGLSLVSVVVGRLWRKGFRTTTTTGAAMVSLGPGRGSSLEPVPNVELCCF